MEELARRASFFRLAGGNRFCRPSCKTQIYIAAQALRAPVRKSTTPGGLLLVSAAVGSIRRLSRVWNSAVLGWVWFPLSVPVAGAVRRWRHVVFEKTMVRGLMAKATFAMLACGLSCALISTAAANQPTSAWTGKGVPWAPSTATVWKTARRPSALTPAGDAKLGGGDYVFAEQRPILLVHGVCPQQQHDAPGRTYNYSVVTKASSSSYMGFELLDVERRRLLSIWHRSQ